MGDGGRSRRVHGASARDDRPPVGNEINDGDGDIFADDQDGPVSEAAGFPGHWSPDATRLVRVDEGGNLVVYDRETGDISVIGTVEVTPRLTEDFMYEMELPSWQRVARS